MTSDALLKPLIDRSRDVINKAFNKYKRIGVAWSGGKDSTAMVRLILDYIEDENKEYPLFLVGDPIPFIETNNYIAETAKKWGIPEDKLVWYTSLLREEHFKNAGEPGKDKQKCCYWLKVVPLNEFIEKYSIEALFVSIRWDEHSERAKEKYFSERKNPEHVRVHPMLHWSWEDILVFFKLRGLPLNPLYYKGYTSLGCKPCTTPVKPEGFKDIDDLIEFASKRILPERAGRDIDKEKIMERLRKLGYF